MVYLIPENVYPTYFHQGGNKIGFAFFLRKKKSSDKSAPNL